MRADHYNTREFAESRLTAGHVTHLTRTAQRCVGLEVDGRCGPATRAVLEGWSPIAMRSPSPWAGRTRPVDYRGAVWGLVVHTTGSGLLERAERNGLDPVTQAVRWYQQSTGTHYVCGYAGELIQVASENQSAHGVGTREQRAAERAPGGWMRKLPELLVNLWRERWGHLDVDRPSKLYPSQHANTCYVHVEMPPLPASRRGEAAGPSLWFTAAQHAAVAKLATDVARRNGFAHVAEWWRTGRLVGHEDLTPVTRPGWDPGWLREKPRFDWKRVQVQCATPA